MKIVNTSEAPQAIGPYSQAMKTDTLLYSSGQIPLDKDGIKVDGGIEEQTKQVLANIEAILASEGLGMDSIVKTTVFLQDMSDFAAMNAIYADAFGDHKPARSTIQVAALPLGALVEIEFIAELKG